MGGHPAGMQADNDEEHMLEPSESLDSDEVRNDDGDEVVDPPEKWLPADDDRTLDERLAEEVPDVTPADVDPADADAERTVVPTPDDQLDRADPDRHGRDSGQVDGSPEDGESFFTIVE